jgi:hypothetical protein
MEKVAVVIPIYKNSLTEIEQISLGQCLSILGNHPILFVAPKSLDLRFLMKWKKEIDSIRFSDHYFQSTKTYNQLLTNLEFYQAFKRFEYILIYQLDAFVFKDDLLEWCAKSFDYIGAPKLKMHHIQGTISCEPLMMNGGFSLRNVRALIRYIRIYQLFFSSWLANEDMMFSFTQKRAYPFRFLLKLPNWKDALAFSIEKNPTKSYEILGKLPFGCHAWERYNPTFWKKFIPQNQENESSHLGLKK